MKAAYLETISLIERLHRILTLSESTETHMGEATSFDPHHADLDASRAHGLMQRERTLLIRERTELDVVVHDRLGVGFLGGLGGAYLSTVGGGLFLPFMTGGAGFIAIVLAMLARGRTWWVLFGALLFGACLSLTTALQVAGVNIPTDVIQMLPFAMVILVLVIFARHSHLPPALGLPYHRGER